VVWERSRVGGSGRAIPAAPSRASGRRCPSPPPTLGFLPAREPIFSQTHTDEFCGIEQSTPEPAGSWAPLRPGRWVYEGGEGRAARGCKKTVMAGFGLPTWLRCPTPLPTLGFLLAREPIFSQTHTNEFCGIEQSTPEPAGSWAPLRPGRWVYEGKENKASVGGMSSRLGTSPRQPSQAAVGPISYFAALAWCPTVCRGTDDFGEHHPSTAAALALGPGDGAASGKTPFGAREYPMCAEGWALWVLGRWPDLYLATGGTYRLGKPQG
jgi:hypothetical protein